MGVFPDLGLWDYFVGVGGAVVQRLARVCEHGTVNDLVYKGLGVPFQ